MKIIFTLLTLGIISIYFNTVSEARNPKCGPCTEECPSTENCKCGVHRDACDCCDICTPCNSIAPFCGKCEPENCQNLDGQCQCDVGKDSCKCCDVCMNCPYQYCNLEVPNQCRNGTICKPPVDLPLEIALMDHVLGQCIHEYES
ncbi:protein draper-like [Centruroides sculpturatus]|uniref:protein draper-like n=1 Tax=Centruroides sculpturatus TaxID=218467 RepID=UPI000C6CC3D3|nr:protein draper-like [Centruroides sculpturatus]